MSAAAKRSQRSSEPVGEQSYCDWFDADGRLVKEGRMRQSVFEGTPRWGIFYLGTVVSSFTLLPSL